jgi:protoporphyrinogen oxidase
MEGNTMSEKTALIIGAGPAGLTAAYELARRTDIRPIVVEQDACVGGIARTENYKGNRIDIGGHRFFSKSSRVMDWWLEMAPLDAGETSGSPLASRQGDEEPEERKQNDLVMLVRHRKSRIFFLRRFFDYPIRPNAATLWNLGLVRTVRIAASYLWSVLRPIRPEANLEQLFINRFGRELYRTFFKSYTEKVWGVPCAEINAEWGAQRVKGLSILKSLGHAVKRQLRWNQADLAQKETETSLIERFLYPKLGPGQLWEEVARRVVALSGEVHLETTARRIVFEDGRVSRVEAEAADGSRREYRPDYVFSSMPVKDLVAAVEPAAPKEIREVAEGLVYRDFVTVGLLARRLAIRDGRNSDGRLIADNWIYIQEPDARVGRMQIFNNWSPYLVAKPDTVWVGLEYFCFEGDDLWRRDDAEIISLATDEMDHLGMIAREDVLDGTVIRMPKAYPAYFGTYDRFHVVRAYCDSVENLFLIGRNGMHRYNNQDHSMLTAMLAVDNIVAGVTDKTPLWQVNTEQDYHEDVGNQGKKG